MAGNEEYDGAVENKLLVFVVSSDVSGSLPWAFNISSPFFLGVSAWPRWMSTLPGIRCWPLLLLYRGQGAFPLLWTLGDTPLLLRLLSSSLWQLYFPASDLQRDELFFSSPKSPWEDWFAWAVP